MSPLRQQIVTETAMIIDPFNLQCPPSPKKIPLVKTLIYIFIFTTSNDPSFGCPTICLDTFHCAFLFIDTSTMLDTT